MGGMTGTGVCRCVERGEGQRRERGGHMHNGKKWSCVVITRPLPTNGGLKLIGQYTTSGNGIKPRFLLPCGKYGQLKGDANLFSFDGSSMGESTGRFLLKCCRYMDAYASTRVY